MLNELNMIVVTKLLQNISKVILFLLILCIVFGACKSPVQRPNIILIMTDDQGWFDAGFNGNDKILTPWLDSLAGMGVVFDRFYSASAVCSPTRASLITGRNPLRMNIPYANSGKMLQEEITIPELLKNEGYSTGHFGKWHLGTLTTTEVDANRGGREKFKEEYSIPTEHGYDEYFCSESKVPTYDPMIFPAKFAEGESKHYGWRAVEKGDSTKAYGTSYWTGAGQKVTENLNGDNSRIIMDRVLPFIDRSMKNEVPFFSTIWFHTPHLPVVSDSKHRKFYSSMGMKEQIYFGAITAMDEQVGRLWKKLEVAGIADETIIFFCSDNGPERGTPGEAGEFRARKRSLYEGGVRVPGFAVWKNMIMGGKRIDFPAVTSDYLPTLVDILGIDYPSSRPLDGTSLMLAITGEQMHRSKPIGFIARPQMSWVTDRYKLIGDLKGESFELFDLIDDRSEKKDIIEEFPELAEKMKGELLAWRKSVDAVKQEMIIELAFSDRKLLVGYWV